MYMRVYACICVYMRVYVCIRSICVRICVVYAAKGGEEADKGRKCPPTLQNYEKSSLKNKIVYSYTLLGGGEFFQNSNGCRRLYMGV